MKKWNSVKNSNDTSARILFGFAAVLLSALTSACSGSHSPDPLAGSRLLPDTSNSDPANPQRDSHHYETDVLLYNGAGVSTSDWQTTEQIVNSEGLNYRLINSGEMNAMTLDEIANYGVIIVPGGSGGTITDNLTPSTRLRIRQAVRERGVSYVGFCAGAWVAVGPEADSGGVADYGLAVAKGDVLDFWYPGGNTSLTAAVVEASFPDASTQSLVWWGGPATPEWKNGVIARYNDGKPAISQSWAGNGFVVISGPHPEAPQGWRSTAGYDPDGLDHELAVQMIHSALGKKPLSVF